jgi:SAM-dependent methyltransferase
VTPTNKESNVVQQHPPDAAPVKQAQRPCPVCGHGEAVVLHHQKFAIPDGHSLPSAYDVVACLRCGFVYADTAATQADYDRYYARFSKYEDQSVASGGGTTEWDARRLERTAADLAAQLPDRTAAVLDVGCANGGLLMVLKRLGFGDLAGLDPSGACVRYVQQQGIDATVGGLFDHDPAREGRFDCVILSHVLEHVRDLGRAVDNMLGLLRPGGLLYVEVPDASRYADFFVVPYYYFDCEHINHFDEHSLRNLVEPRGCELVAVGRKELPASSVHLYPAVYAAFRKGRGGTGTVALSPDEGVRHSVEAYVRISATADRYAPLEELADSGRELVVWGAGSYTLRLMETTPLGRCNIIAFVDKDTAKQGTRLKGIAIGAPALLRDFTGPIAVSSALYGQDIAAEIRAMGLKNDLIML